MSHDSFQKNQFLTDKVNLQNETKAKARLLCEIPPPGFRVASSHSLAFPFFSCLYSWTRIDYVTHKLMKRIDSGFLGVGIDQFLVGTLSRPRRRHEQQKTLSNTWHEYSQRLQAMPNNLSFHPSHRDGKLAVLPGHIKRIERKHSVA